MALDLEYFKFTHTPTYGQTDSALLSDGYVKNHSRYLFNAAFDYVKVPLSIERDNQRIEEIVKNQASLHLGASYRLKKDLLFGFRTRMTRLAGDSEGIFMGDTFLESIWKFYQKNRTAVALHPRFTLPTGSQEYTTQNRTVGAYLGLNFERKFDWFQAALNLGYSRQPGATLNFGPNFSEIDYRESVFAGLGFLFPIANKWAANLEAYRYTQMKGDQHPNEIYAGARHQTTHNWATFGGISSGGGHIDGSSNDYRFSVGIKFYPSAERKVVAQAPRPAPVPVTKPKNKREELLAKEKAEHGALIHSENVYFANNSTALNENSRMLLDGLKSHLGSGDKVQVVLEGFASARGNSEKNFILSEKRAMAVQNYLGAQGLDVARVKSVAYGDAKADSEKSEALNRKVMVRIYKK